MLDQKIPKSKVFLSRRNLLTLLSKLDRENNGDETKCAIIKHKQPVAAYQQSMESIMVVAVQDELYYPSQNRTFGDVHPDDDPDRIHIVNEV